MADSHQSIDPRSRMVLVFFRTLARTGCAILTTSLIFLPSTVTGFPADCVDHDGDGYGSPGDPSCPGGLATDCDDNNGDVYPGAPQLCDGVNNDCYDPDWPSLDDWAENVISTASLCPQSEFAADLDGDDDVDVLSMDGCSDGIYWYENKSGIGLVWNRRFIGGDPDLSSVIAGDLDGDGDLDVLSSSEAYDMYAPLGFVRWYENVDGDASVWVSRTIAWAEDRSALSVFAADVDGDDDLDVLSCWSSPGKVVWYENTSGDGSDWVEHVISGTGVSSVFAFDLDGDEDVDVLSASLADDEISWFENTTGDGSSWTARTIATSGNGVWAVFAADVDGDEDLDVLSALNNDDNIAWYENRFGDGLTWTEWVIPATADSPTEVFAVDLDGDDDVDVLSGSFYDDKIAWYENSSGDGVSWVEHIVSASDWRVTSILAADLEGDGDLNIVSGLSKYSGGKIAWYNWEFYEQDDDGDGLAECDGDCLDNNPNCTTDCETDLDEDGIPYCADTCVDGDGDQRGTPGGSGYSCAGADCDDADPNNWISCASCADADDDGYFAGCDVYDTIEGPDCDDTNPYCEVDCTDDDLDDRCPPTDCDDTNEDVYPGASEVCDGVNNDCDHPFWPEPATWTAREISVAASGATAVFATDMDGDQDVDVLSASRDDNKIAWYRNETGDGSIWTERLISISVIGAQSVFAVDVDGDGDMDVLSAAILGDEIRWFENLSGEGSAWGGGVISTSADGAASVFGIDVDGDGDTDVLSASRIDDKVAWYENVTGDGSVWTEQVISTAANAATSVFATDVDGDGDVDVLSASFGDDKVAWYENLAGDGTAWSERVVSTSDDFPESVFAADVDDDGDMDLLVAAGIGDEVILYENTTGDGSEWTRRLISDSANGARSVFAADVDGDGDLDVLSASFHDEISWYENRTGNGTDWYEYVVSTSADGPQSIFAADLDGDADADVLSASYYDDTIAWFDRELFDGDHDGDGLAVCEGDCDDNHPGCTTDCSDADGDETRACEGDCDDADADTYPGAPETNDGVDNQCPGDEGHGLVDEIEGECGFHDPDDRAEYSWPAQPGATLYDVARFSTPASPMDCTTVTTADTFVVDPEEPPSGSVFHFLVRALAPNTGSWGQDSEGTERTDVCP